MPNIARSQKSNKMMVFNIAPKLAISSETSTVMSRNVSIQTMLDDEHNQSGLGDGIILKPFSVGSSNSS